MSNIENIKAEIKRLKKILEESTYYLDNSQQALGYSFALDDFKEFIDSLPEEDTTEDLNELIQKWDRIDINTVLKVKVKATGKVIDGFYDGRGHFDHFIDHDVFDRYSIDEVELMPEEKPSEDLDEEIEMEWDSFNKHLVEYGEESEEVIWLNWFSFNDIACYFYELGKQSKEPVSHNL